MTIKYKGVAKGADTVALKFNRLHVEWNPTTVAALLAFAHRWVKLIKAREKESGGAAPVDVDVAPTPGGRGMATPGGGKGMTINAELQALSVSLNTDGSGERLALLGMQELVVDTLLSAEGGMMMKGQLAT